MSYAWTVIGAGPAGIAAVGRLLDHGIAPEEIAWVDFDEAQSLPLPTVTRMMLKEAVLRMDDPERPKPFMRFRQGAMRPDKL